MGFLQKSQTVFFQQFLTIFIVNFSNHVLIKVQLLFLSHINYKMKKENEYDSLMNQKVNIYIIR